MILPHISDQLGKGDVKKPFIFVEDKESSSYYYSDSVCKYILTGIYKLIYYYSDSSVISMQ